MRLYGTLTSPFVRRVWVVALELGVDTETCDTTSAAGQEALRRATPIGKVPVAELEGEVVFDSHAIIDALLARRGHGPLRPPGGAAERNFVVALDDALGAAIRLFYFRRDGVAIEGIPYMLKERDRVATIMTWLDGQVAADSCTPAPGFGLAELALVTAIDWMRYRGAYEVGAHAGLLAVHRAHAGRASLQATLPP